MSLYSFLQSAFSLESPPSKNDICRSAAGPDILGNGHGGRIEKLSVDPASLATAPFGADTAGHALLVSKVSQVWILRIAKNRDYREKEVRRSSYLVGAEQRMRKLVQGL